MSYPDHSGGPYPAPRDHREQMESQYPPPPGEYPAPAYQQRPPPTLPPINSYEPNYGPPPSSYPPDPRAYRPDQYHPQQPQYSDRQYQHHPPDYGRPPQQHVTYAQSAPRQRTAIACRYCRRRKIRCSGYEDAPNGKCANCTRFQQECLFTPVSSQAQAFVPAHAAYPHMRNVSMGPDGRPRAPYPQGQQLYGAHGQPLGPLPASAAAPVLYADYPTPSPTASYPSSYPDDRLDAGRKRPQGEPHPTILPPPVPGQPAYPRDESRRPPVAEEYRLPPVAPPTTQAGPNYSPVSSTSTVSGRRPGEGLPSMSHTPPPPRRTSPGDRADPMSLTNIMAKPNKDLDSSMLGRLNRKA